MEKSNQATYIAYPFLRFSEELHYRRRRLYIPPSNWMKCWLIIGFIHEEIPVIPNSVDLNDYKLEESDLIDNLFAETDFGDNKIILFEGWLLALKGVNVLNTSHTKYYEETSYKKVLFAYSWAWQKC
jgi:hypothetical protein